MYGYYGVLRVFPLARAGLAKTVGVPWTDNLQGSNLQPRKTLRNIFFAMFVAIPLAMTPPNFALLTARNGRRPDARPPALASAADATPASELR